MDIEVSKGKNHCKFIHSHVCAHDSSSRAPNTVGSLVSYNCGVWEGVYQIGDMCYKGTIIAMHVRIVQQQPINNYKHDAYSYYLTV